MKTTYARTPPDPVVTPDAARGIGRCCTRGFAGVEVAGTVGQWAGRGARDYSVKRDVRGRVDVWWRHVTAEQSRRGAAGGSGRIRLQPGKWKKLKNK